MTQEQSMRSRLIQAIRDELWQEESVLAFWEQGSAAFGRADEWSDLDLLILVKEGCVAPAWQKAERAICSISPIELRLELPHPTWHGHWQAFYKLAEAGPYLLIDMVVMEESHPNRFLEQEIHGKPLLYFDRYGLVRPAPTDQAEFALKLQTRLLQLESVVEMMHPFIEKELRRGRDLDALHFYHSLLLARLIEALRIRYCPWRYNFNMRYLSHDLPAETYAQLHPLCFIASPDELLTKKERVLALFRETLRELKEIKLTELLAEAKKEA